MLFPARSLAILEVITIFPGPFSGRTRALPWAKGPPIRRGSRGSAPMSRHPSGRRDARATTRAACFRPVVVVDGAARCSVAPRRGWGREVWWSARRTATGRGAGYGARRTQPSLRPHFSTSCEFSRRRRRHRHRRRRRRRRRHHRRHRQSQISIFPLASGSSSKSRRH